MQIQMVVGVIQFHLLHLFEKWQPVKVNIEHHKLMNTNFFWSELDDLDTNDMGFQPGDAAWLTAYATLGILHERFKGVVISLEGGMWTG